jgi:hypothetical protein
MTTHSPRYTARPSRSRITLARVGAWFDRHDDAVTLVVVAVVVAIVSTLAVLALVVDYGVSTSHALAVAVLMVTLGAFSAFFAYIVGSDRAARRVSRRYSRHMSEQSAAHDRDYASLKARAIGTRDPREMSAYDMSAELARLSEREHALRYALRYTVRNAMSDAR